MRFRIDWKAFRSEPLHTGRIVICAIVLGVLLSMAYSRPIRSSTRLEGQFFTPLHVMVGRILVNQGIKRFGGPLEDPWWWSMSLSELWRILFGTVFMLILAPTLLVWGVKARWKWRENRMSKRSLPLIEIALILGLSGVGGLVPIAMVSGIMTPRAYAQMKSEQAASSNLDAVVTEVQELALKAHTFYFLPVEEGGGGGRWTDVPGRESPALTLEDLGSPRPPEARLGGSFFPQQPSRFSLEVSREEVIIQGVGLEDGDGDGTPVTVSMWVRADPKSDSLSVVNR